MKKIIIVVMLACLASCFKTTVYPGTFKTGYLHDQCNFGDTLFYTIDCTIKDESAILEFAKKAYILQDTVNVWFQNENYSYRKNSVVISTAKYEYTAETFKEMLLEKRAIHRDGIAFNFDGEMYSTWRIFDRMYAAVSEW